MASETQEIGRTIGDVEWLYELVGQTRGVNRGGTRI